MGVFSKLFRSSPNIKKEMELAYVMLERAHQHMERGNADEAVSCLFEYATTSRRIKDGLKEIMHREPPKIDGPAAYFPKESGQSDLDHWYNLCHRAMGLIDEAMEWVIEKRDFYQAYLRFLCVSGAVEQMLETPKHGKCRYCKEERMTSKNSLTSNIKKQLESLYIPMFQMMMGMPLSQAMSTFHDLYSQAENEAKAEGSIYFPINLGDILLEQESTRQGAKAMLSKRRREVVRDEDIRWWMNRHELDRKMMTKFDDVSKFALFLKLRQEDRLSEEEAGRQVKKYFPIFGDPDDTSTSSGDDRPLPFELKDRINLYIQARSQKDPAKYKEDMTRSSSFNALIRKEIKAGNV